MVCGATAAGERHPPNEKPSIEATASAFNSEHAGYDGLRAEVAELVDAPDSKSGGVHAPCGFKSHLRHFSRGKCCRAFLAGESAAHFLRDCGASLRSHGTRRIVPPGRVEDSAYE